MNIAKPRDAFTEMFRAAKSSAEAQALRAGGRGGAQHHSRLWANALTRYCVQPETCPKEEVEEYDDEFVVIRDKFPKAEYHLLVMPRKEVEGLRCLKQDSLPMLEKLVAKGEAVAKRIKMEHPEVEFRIGFHSVPSMRQLHMHVISQDFVSAALKTKKHWNSFTTDFFLDAPAIVEKLRNEGGVKLDEKKHEELLKLPLKCHKCAKKPANLPQLKEHLLTHVPKIQ